MRIRVFALFVLAALPPLLIGAADEDLAKEMKRFPAVEPADALKTFDVAEGFSLELVAHEPLVSDPVDACFDADGRMFVAEMHGYPYSFEPRKQQPKGGGKKDAGIIRLLEDIDGDGRFDKGSVFADELSWPTSVCCYNGGVFVIASPHVIYLKDTDGDNRADVREIVYSGLSRFNVQGLANNLKWGLDNHIYFAAGRTSADMTHRGKKSVSVRASDLKFKPSTEHIEAVTGGSQFGHSMDDWGNRFVCSNSNHIQHVVWDRRDVNRNPNFAASNQVRSIAKEGGAAPVFRKSPAEPWRIVRTRRRAADPAFNKRLPPTELVPIGFFTSATGVTVYRGSAYPEKWHGNVFIGDVGGNLIHRKILSPSGVSFVATRADQGREFVTSADTWFRPTNFVNGPDGALYVLDMYRETIEHPVSIPDDIKAHVDLESGDDRGRIYRLVSPEMQRLPPVKLSSATNKQLVAALTSSNAWHRETAQRLLVERNDASSVGRLAALLTSEEGPKAHAHAIWTLEGIRALTSQHVLAALNNRHPRVREQALLLTTRFAKEPSIADRIVTLCQDSDPRVQWRAALALSDCDSNRRVTGLTAISVSANSTDLQSAVLTSIGDDAIGLLQNIVKQQRKIPDPFLARLAKLAAVKAKPVVLVAMLTSTLSKPKFADQLMVASDSGLRTRGSSVSQAIQQSDAESRQALEAFFASAAKTVGDSKADTARRSSAAARLAFANDEQASQLGALLSPAEPVEVQRAAIGALGRRATADGAKLLLEGWRGYSPDMRRLAAGELLGRTKWTLQMLAAIESGDVSPGDIALDRKQLLLNHPEKSIRAKARAVLAKPTATRQVVADRYKPALDMDGDPAAGLVVFKKVCANCHRVGTTGHAVGPDLQSVQNKSPEDLLISILDPNRDVQPNYYVYGAVTEQGKVVNGIIVNDSTNSITLRAAEAKEQTVLRRNLESLTSTRVSLMPEGVEKDLSIKQSADLISFIKSLRPPDK